MMKKLLSIRLYTNFFIKMTMSQQLIDVFVICRMELIVLTLGFQIKANFTFFQKNL